jgi:hypothetical protein
VWLERVEPKKPRVPRPDLIAVRVSDLAEKEALLASDSDKFFTELRHLSREVCPEPEVRPGQVRTGVDFCHARCHDSP